MQLFISTIFYWLIKAQNKNKTNIVHTKQLLCDCHTIDKEWTIYQLKHFNLAHSK